MSQINWFMCTLLFSWTLGLNATGQSRVQGRVIDEETGKALAFVHMVVNDSRSGTTTDIDGRFHIRFSAEIRSLKLSYVGYDLKTIVLDDYLRQHPGQTRQTLLLTMKPGTTVLKELVFEARENPAHRIIRKAVENRKINNPEKIKSFKYKSYNKFFIDAEGIEEDDEEFQDFITTKYLFLMESVTERKYIRPDRSKETVLANRVSGFKNPLFTTLANSFQPFTFYGDYIQVAGKNYLNPISKGSTKKYFFALQDSIYSNGHKVYIISFEPRKKNFEGLEGLVYINTYKYAIENVIAETANLFEHLNDNVVVQFEDNDESTSNQGAITFTPEEEIQNKDSIQDATTQADSTQHSSNNDFEQVSVTFKIQQKYELVDDSIWFPLQLNTDITIGDATGNSNAALKGIGHSYLSEIEILPELRKREFDRLAVEFHPKANKRDSLYWKEYRVEPLDDRGFETYQYIDSVGEEVHLDRIVTGFALLTTGKIRTGKFDIDAKTLSQYNRYESVRLGFGAHTNPLLSTFFNVGGYGAYGFLDKDFKYGGDVNLFLTDANDVTLSFLYQKDVKEFAGTQLFLDNNPLSSETNRKFMIDNMDKYEKMEVALSFYFLKYMDVRAAFSQSTVEATSGYLYAISTDVGFPVLTNNFDFTELKLGFKYSFREKFIEVFGNKVSVGTKYPVIWVNYTRGFDGVGDGDYNYEKWDFKLQKSFLIKGFGQPSFTMKGGLATGNVPGTNLFNGNGSKVWQIPLEASNSFQTMELGEFLSDRYLALYYTHSLGKIRINPRRSTPEFIIITNVGFGSLDNPQLHQNYSFKTMEKGYYESGLSIRDLYKLKGFIGLGLAGFYRYGPYGYDTFGDNVMVKLSVRLSF